MRPRWWVYCILFSELTCVVASFKKINRTAPEQVVGWPPICSFRKKLTSSSSVKSAIETQNVVPNKSANKKPMEICQKGLFVKINMDGIPIGRKVDVKAYDREKAISGLLDGNGEYTLVYEVNGGDMMLVEDVPWHLRLDSYKQKKAKKLHKSSKLLNKKAEAKAGEASLEISSSLKERVAIATDVGVKASSTLSELVGWRANKYVGLDKDYEIRYTRTVNVSSPMPNEAVGSSSASGTSKKPIVDELIEDKSKANIQHGSSH
ncbi:hypothetical protein H5410_061151 [Solanum commersonii]|uniref:Auxin-responsive protein n=1 Tax=Solanum commersonii TaxID=4109 RepID=A0A9J5W7C7_SOLCO|nr:hypothetical protein H5410_061151 [Solanum commersonii]